MSQANHCKHRNPYRERKVGRRSSFKDWFGIYRGMIEGDGSYEKASMLEHDQAERTFRLWREYARASIRINEPGYQNAIADTDCHIFSPSLLPQRKKGKKPCGERHKMYDWEYFGVPGVCN